MEILIHHLDTLRFLLGELAVDAARLERTSEATRGEDVAAIALHRVADGVPVFVTGNLAVPGAPPLPSDALTHHRQPRRGDRRWAGSDACRASIRSRIGFDRGGELCPGLSRHHRAFPRRAGAGRGLRDGAGGQSAHARPGGGGLSQKRLRKRAPGLIGSRAGTSGGWTDDGRVRDCGGGRRGPGGSADRPRARGGHHLRPAGAGDAADRGYAAVAVPGDAALRAAGAGAARADGHRRARAQQGRDGAFADRRRGAARSMRCASSCSGRRR